MPKQAFLDSGSKEDASAGADLLGTAESALISPSELGMDMDIEVAGSGDEKSKCNSIGTLIDTTAALYALGVCNRKKWKKQNQFTFLKYYA